jgi:hypothetical protein
MIFTFPAIFSALFFSDPVSRSSDNGNTSSSKRDGIKNPVSQNRERDFFDKNDGT